jgi:poly(3-hydroxybutyrate) depolymerase
MKKLLTLIVALALTAGALQLKAQSITVDGTQRKYIVYVPKNLGQKKPLLISCHGMNQDPNYQKGMLQIESVADTAKFVTVFPEGIDKGWDISGDRDIHFVEALIDKMESQYKIDRDRVYLSGFSMGGMFTYHAMNKIADKIAAFAPISGYPMWGGNFSSSRPVPIIHTHGTSDDVVSFGGVQNILNGWIQRNGCPKTAKTTKNYRGTPHITRHVWGPGLEGVEVVLMEMADKGHWISNDYGVKTGEEIWNFCKRYTLNKTAPKVVFTAPTAGTQYINFAPGRKGTFPDVTITAEATDANGTIEKVDFYDGNKLIGTVTEAPYTVVLSSTSYGDHQLKAVATDNDGETGEAYFTLPLTSPQLQVLLHQNFTADGSVPAGWTTFDSSVQRTGPKDGFTSGCRIIQFTGSKHDFEYGLYFRNVKGNKREGWAKFGLPTSCATLTMAPGNYILRYKVCNWNKPQFSPVTVCIEKAATGEAVAESQYTPTVNIGNDASKDFNGTRTISFQFNIPEQGDYVVAYYTDDAAWADAVLGYAALSVKSYGTDGISDAPLNEQATNMTIYDLQGRRLDSRQLTHGVYVKNGRKFVVK